MASHPDSFDPATMAAVHALLQTKHRYGAYVDQAIMNPTPENAARLASVFVEDAVLDFPGLLGRFEGRDTIINIFTEQVPKGTRLSWHSFHSPIVEIDGDRATGSWTMLALVKRFQQEGNEPIKIYGRYADEFVLTNEGWKISLLRFHKESED